MRSEEASEKNFASERKAQVSFYTPRQLEKYTKIITGVRAGNLPASKLEKIEEFLEKLKHW
ncbi:hypothetical protein HYV50_05750 [Candidatus Pacearchaeota archaeon]|nr:hypothetical protein [Candidatus Pacearchaeota archaeon]